jgi:uncharacterized membrane protein YjjP (DUF1212 family)
MEDTANNNQERSFLSLYAQEVFEAAVCITIVQLVMDKQFDAFKLFKYSIMIGLMTYGLEKYNPDFKIGITQGITFTVGAQIMSKFA